jgi:Methyltransferase domain
MPELLLGAGKRHKKVLWLGDQSEWTDLITVDIEGTPTLLHDLNIIPWPLPDNAFTEVHAYEVLEHLGSQGDWRAFFDHFHEIWRVLAPDGHLFATCPDITSPWLWGDPGHTRIVTRESLTFLSQKCYANQQDVTAMTDYRHYWRGDFDMIWHKEDGATFGFVLKALKP